MKNFSILIQELGSSKSTKKQIEKLLEYFGKADDQEKLEAIALLTKKRPKRLVSPLNLRIWATDLAEIPDWLFDECYNISGDQSEITSLILPIKRGRDAISLTDVISQRNALENKDLELIKESVINAWQNFDQFERQLYNKILTGTFRKTISVAIISKALAKYLQVEESKLTHRLTENWSPERVEFSQLLLTNHYKDQISQPYPFYYGLPLDRNLTELGNPKDWAAEWKWHGERAQIIWRDSELFIWSKSKELVTQYYPELQCIVENIDYDFVIDGEIIAYHNGKPLPNSHLSKRIGKTKQSKNLLKANPVVFMAYDIMEFRAIDIRQENYLSRQSKLITLISNANRPQLLHSQPQAFESWEQLSLIIQEARAQKVLGLVIKSCTSSYGVERNEGNWWKLKAEPYYIKAVLIYAHRSQIRRSRGFESYSFALWNADELVTFVKIENNLSEAETKEIASFVKKNTIERFGPVYSVHPSLLFEITFEGIQESKRHKSGVILRRAKIKEWLKNSAAEDANKLDEIKNLI